MSHEENSPGVASEEKIKDFGSETKVDSGKKIEYLGPEKKFDEVGTSSIDPNKRVDLAKSVLKGLLWLAVSGVLLGLIAPAGLTYLSDDSVKMKDFLDFGASVIDMVKTTLPPIATLVIGYYFGSKSD